MNTTITEYYRTVEIIDTPTGRVHVIDWKYYLPREFFKSLAKHIKQLGWMQSGQYRISHNEKRTVVTVDERILRDFSDIAGYVAQKYLN